MTDEEKAEEYFCEHCKNSFEHDNGHCSNCSKWDYFIAGLAEGRKEGGKDIEVLTKENEALKQSVAEGGEIIAELKAQLTLLENRICSLKRKNASLENKIEKMIIGSLRNERYGRTKASYIHKS